jgi:hypothetical protein
MGGRQKKTPAASLKSLEPTAPSSPAPPRANRRGSRGDRQKYWQTYGFTFDNDCYQAVLEGFLIPLGSNDQPLPGPTEGYPSLGTVRLTSSTASGTTFSANSPVTKELREALMTPGGFPETNTDGPAASS